MYKLTFIIAGTLALASAPSTAAAPSHTAAKAGDAAVAATTFVDAFNALDRSRFDPLFAEDVTLFFPGAPFDVRRVEGKAAVLTWFGRFFDAAKAKQGKLNIEPQDLQVQDYGNFAIATFHLSNNDAVGRRTLVLRKMGSEWKIVHLHASSQPLKTKS